MRALVCKEQEKHDVKKVEVHCSQLTLSHDKLLHPLLQELVVLFNCLLQTQVLSRSKVQLPGYLSQGHLLGGGGWSRRKGVVGVL